MPTTLKPYHTGQVPVRPLVVSVTGQDDLSASYDDGDLVLINPAGTEVDTSGGILTFVGGQAQYTWPNTSLFATEGRYRAKVALHSGAKTDYTDEVYIEVTELS